jgi:hypothetical protein
MKWLALVLQFVVSTISFAQTMNGSSSAITRLGEHITRRWSIDFVESTLAEDSSIAIAYTIRSGSAEIFIIDGHDKRVMQFANLVTSGLIKIPSTSLAPGSYHAVMSVNSRRVAVRSFRVIARAASKK